MRCLLTLACLLAWGGLLAQQLPLVRVGLASYGSVSEFKVSSEHHFGAYRADTNELIAKWPAGAEAKLKASGAQVQISSTEAAGEWLAPVPEVYFSSEGPKLTLVGQAIRRDYRGWLHFSARNGRPTAVNEIALESYLMGVVPCEMPPSWHPEALKAQAVAARTYALTRIGAFEREGYDIDDTTRSQTYKGATAENPRTNEAIRLTSNQILVFDGRPIQALYATVSGGITASAAEAFQSAGAPYLIAFEDVDENGKPYAEGARFFAWTADFTAADLAPRLGVGEVSEIDIDGRTESGRVARVKIRGSQGAKEVPAQEFRRVLGVDSLRSTLFEVSRTNAGWRFEGRGWGHGVGMCQSGADGRAKAGQTYDQILAAYYPGTTLLIVRTSPLELATRGSFVERRKFGG